MEIKKEVILRNIVGEAILVPVGETAFEYSGVFALTETGERLWQAIEEGKDEKELTDLLVREFDVDEHTAAEDVSLFLEKLRNFGII